MNDAAHPPAGDETTADVLVVGGGPAGMWSALTAVAAGARVILVDKARCGRSGPSANGTVALWDIPPGPGRDEVVAHSFSHGGGLGDPEWLDRVLGETHHRIDPLLRWGYRQAGDALGPSTRVRLDGRRYLGALRRGLLRAGVRVLDHHQALYLLVDSDGVVCGAGGAQVRDSFRSWTVRAGGVVLATGGCAFLSGGAGTDGATGEGLLMAAEAGGELSGMEFSGAYSLASAADPRDVRFGALFDESGALLEGDEFTVRSAALTALAQGRRIYADPMRGSAVRLGPRAVVPAGTTAVPGIPDHRADPSGRVRLRAVLEGTVRGSGGLRLVGFDCATTVPGLYAAGDIATREPVTGAVGGFGGHGGGWAISSGMWAGSGAERFARQRGRVGRARPLPGAGLNPRSGIDARAVVGLVQEHTLPMRRSYWRSAGSLRDSIAELDAIWPVTECELGGIGADRVRARQAAALLAVARWTKYSALARTETRGVHRRTDHPGATQDWCRRLLTGGVSQVWVRPA
ncbi:FAD-dependent oxidoreductase [Nocardia spumae]|uniref:FAD-dependent oxidoreductase n=1 Tax=Nocardia spumae TaxID=2887190 RepID=UPI001D13EB66|nr:FAD-binding protein [Nocardia spumae]